MSDPYAVLGVREDAPPEVVQAAYRALSKKHHPDRGGSQGAFVEVKEAYEAILEDADAAAAAADGGAAVSVGDASATRVSHRGVTVRGEHLTLTLRGLLDDMDVGAVVADHRVPEDPHRPVAFLEVHNRSDRRLPWRGHRNLRLIGDDGYVYEPAPDLRPHVEKLPPRWKGSDVELEAGARVNAVVVGEAIPERTTITNLVYTQPVYAPEGTGGGLEDTERYGFDVAPEDRRRLDEVPFDV